jgi:hypothetical protein
VDPFWRRLLQDQQASGFSDLAGTHGSVVLPVSDRLVTRLVVEQASPEWPVSIVDIRAEDNDRFAVAVRLKGPAFLPPARVRFDIERQPEFPRSPVLALRIVPDALTRLATPFMAFLKRLPAGVAFDGSVLTLDLAVLLSAYGPPDSLRHLTALSLHTLPGRFVLSVEAQV